MNATSADDTTTAKFDPGPLLQVRTLTSGDQWTLVFSKVFAHSREAVWSALTDPEQLPAWAPYTANRNLGRVGPATVTMIDGPDGAELDGKVTLADPPAILEHAWGDNVLRWELKPVAEGTELTLFHTLDDPELLPMVTAGWHLCLLVVDRYLTGSPIGPIVGEKAKEYGWEQLRDSYRAILGPM